MILMAAPGTPNDEIGARLRIRRAKWSACGERASLSNDWRGWKNETVQDVPGLISPERVLEVRAWACERRGKLGLPLSGLSVADVAKHAHERGIVRRISDSTVCRWLHEDAIRPWQHRCSIFARDRQWQSKAARILDLYAGTWAGV